MYARGILHAELRAKYDGISIETSIQTNCGGNCYRPLSGRELQELELRDNLFLIEEEDGKFMYSYSDKILTSSKNKLKNVLKDFGFRNNIINNVLKQKYEEKRQRKIAKYDGNGDGGVTKEEYMAERKKEGANFATVQYHKPDGTPVWG